MIIINDKKIIVYIQDAAASKRPLLFQKLRYIDKV